MAADAHPGPRRPHRFDEEKTAVATFLVDLSPAELADRLQEALRVYVDAMHYPPGTEHQRAGMWLEHTRRPGWRAVAAVTVPDDTDDAEPTPARLRAGPMLGVAYGYRGAADQWWQQQVVQGLARARADHATIHGLLSDYFELTELHIHPAAQGRGLGEALARRLLADRRETHVLLSTPEINGEDNRAWRLYRRLGFADVIRGHRFVGDPRPFAILGRELPL